MSSLVPSMEGLNLHGASSSSAQSSTSITAAQQRTLKEVQAVVSLLGKSKVAYCSNCLKVRSKDEFLQCSQCKAVKYCNKICQCTHWNEGGHHFKCKSLAIEAINVKENLKEAAGVPKEPRKRPDCSRDVWTWRTTLEVSAMRPKFYLEQIQRGPEQQLDPLFDGIDHVTLRWLDHNFIIKEGTKPIFTASIIPPAVKSILQQGLKDKRISWEYLYHGCGHFLDLLRHDSVRNTDKEMVAEWIIRADVKPDGGLILEELTECWWRSKTSPGTPDYDPAIHKVLQDYDHGPTGQRG